MATGIPSKNRRRSKSEYRLDYDGKLPIKDILDGPKADLRCLFEAPTEKLNRVIYGDNLPILRTLLKDKIINNNIKLIYIDPPFSTGSDFESRDQNYAYNDSLRGGNYLEFLRQRLIILKEMLAEDGSIYVHLDGKMAFPVKVLMDEIFGENNFKNWITRRKTNPKNYTRKAFGNISDYILFYTKSEKYIWNQQFDSLSYEICQTEYRHIEKETNRRFMKVPLHAPGIRKGETGKKWRGIDPPPGKHWQYLPSKLEEMDKRGEIYWSSNGNPRRKIYLDNNKGIGIQDIWWNFKDAHNQNIKITGYPTEKNPELLKLILQASSRESDIVMDAFGGSGTLADTASQLNRKWIIIDNSLLAIKTTIKRLINGTEKMGDYVTKKTPKQAQFDLPHKVKAEFCLYSSNSENLAKIPKSEIILLKKAFN